VTAPAIPAGALLRLLDSNQPEPYDSRETQVNSGTDDPTRDGVSTGSSVAIGPSGSHPVDVIPRDADEALHDAIKAAVDARDYERAALLVDVAKKTAKRPARVTPLAVVRQEQDAKD
jgi:hypothetical protein